MSLYGDLPTAKDGSSSTNKSPWGGFKAPVPKMAPPRALQTKKMIKPKVPLMTNNDTKPTSSPSSSLTSNVPVFAPPPSKKLTIGVPRALLQKNEISFSKPGLPVPKFSKPLQIETKPKPAAPTFSTFSMPKVVSQKTIASGVQDDKREIIIHEYDPSRPNDYEEFCMERERKKKLNITEEKEQEEEASSNSNQPMEQDAGFNMPPTGFKMPPPILKDTSKIDLKMSGDEIFARRQAMSAQPIKMAPPKVPTSAMIIAPPVSGTRKSVARPSRVILMMNMVGRGEVDNELEGEIKTECLKYGTVIRCKVFENLKPGIPETEAVRIFVQFNTITAASKALKVMNGRFFAGRTVKARWYEEGVFNKGDYEL